MRVEQRLDPDGRTVGWTLGDESGPQVWCGELERAEFLDLPREQQAGLRDDLGWYLVELQGRGAIRLRTVLARVCDEPSGLKLARAYLRGRAIEQGLPSQPRPDISPATA